MNRIVSIEAPGNSARPIVVPYIDEVGIHERADFFAKRSIKKQSKLDALYACIRMCDLTTLEGADTPGKVRQMCNKAIQPAPAILLQASSGG